MVVPPLPGERFIPRALRIAAAVGFLVFAAAFAALLLAPAALERRAREYVVERMRGEAVKRYPGLGAISRFEEARGQLRAQVARAQEYLQSEEPDIIGLWLASLCKHDCGDRAAKAAAIARTVREGERSAIGRLEATFEKLKGWAQGRYDGLIGELVRDLRIFTGTNAVLLLLAFVAARSTEAPRGVLTTISALLIGASALGVWGYVFAQNWVQTIIFADYTGAAYAVWMAVILVVELDVVFNKARLVRGVVDGIGALLGAILQA